MDKLFPDSAYQLTHNALFPYDCVHVENLGGEMGNPALHNRRLTLGAMPWRFKGGEAAFCRAFAIVDEEASKPTKKAVKKRK
jgi:kynurenine formamidase